MIKRNSIGLLLAAVAFCLSSAPSAVAVAEDGIEAGHVAGFQGTVEIGRGEPPQWSDAMVGTTVHVGDTVRTGPAGAVRLMMRDDSVLNIGENSALVIDQLFAPAESGSYRAVLKLLEGKIRALVSEYYGKPQASYQIETPTSVSGVRGTEFIVTYDKKAAVTEVVGISGAVDVHSIADRDSNAVRIRASELTRIQRNRKPTPVESIGGDRLRRYLDGLEFIGSGTLSGINEGVALGVTAPRTERATATLRPTQPAPAPGDGSDPAAERTPGGRTGQPTRAIEQPPGEVEVPF